MNNGSMNLPGIASITVSHKSGSEFQWLELLFTCADGSTFRLAAHGDGDALPVVYIGSNRRRRNER